MLLKSSFKFTSDWAKHFVVTCHFKAFSMQAVTQVCLIPLSLLFKLNFSSAPKQAQKESNQGPQDLVNYQQVR